MHFPNRAVSSDAWIVKQKFPVIGRPREGQLTRLLRQAFCVCHNCHCRVKKLPLPNKARFSHAAFGKERDTAENLIEHTFYEVLD
jgi:hypothetical protein